MIQTYTRLKAADNTGVRQLMCINVLGGTRKRFAKVSGQPVDRSTKIIAVESLNKGYDVAFVLLKGHILEAPDAVTWLIDVQAGFVIVSPGHKGTIGFAFLLQIWQ